MNKYQLFCHQLVQGKVPHRREYYILESEDGGSGKPNVETEKIQIISPTQSSVEKAKSEVEKEGINSDVMSDLLQSGGSGSKSGSSKKKKKGPNKRVSKNVSNKKKKKKSNNKYKSKKQKSSKGKNSKFKKRHPVWM